MKIKSLLLATSLFSLSLLAPKAAFAHLVETNYQARFDNFEIQTTFSSGEAFPDAPVTVYSPENPDEPLFVGHTDKDGKFSFKPDIAKEGNWMVEIGEADDSHWDRLIVPVNEQGIEVDAVSELPSQPEHHHDYFAYSFLLAIIILGIIYGTRQPKNTFDE